MTLQALDWSLIGRAGLPVAAALAGGVVGALGGGERRLTAGLVVNFAVGAFLALTLLHLLPEAAAQIGWPAGLAAAAVGWVLCVLLARWAGGFCPACVVQDPGAGAETPDGRPGAPRSLAERMRVGIPFFLVVAIHSALDGVALAGTPGHQVDLLGFAVLVHKLPEGMMIAAMTRSVGAGFTAALAATTLIEAGTFLGLAAGIAAGGAGAAVLGLGMALVAGSFLYLVAATLRSNAELPRPALHLASAATGGLLVLVVQLFTRHSH